MLRRPHECFPGGEEVSELAGSLHFSIFHFMRCSFSRVIYGERGSTTSLITGIKKQPGGDECGGLCAECVPVTTEWVT